MFFKRNIHIFSLNQQCYSDDFFPEENHIPACHQPENHASNAENDGKVLRVVDENDVDDKERDGNDGNDETGSGCSSDNEDSGTSRRSESNL